MPEIDGLELSVSYDGGENWSDAKVPAESSAGHPHSIRGRDVAAEWTSLLARAVASCTHAPTPAR